MPVTVFGNGAVQTAYVSYKAYELTEDLQLYWPNSYQDTENVVAAYMSVTTNIADLSVTLPDATQVSVGQNFIISNTGVEPFILRNYDGEELQVIAIADEEEGVGGKYYFILQDNSTAAGEWESTTFGAGTSEADATALAGMGLIPLTGKLNTNYPSVIISSTPYVVTADDRAAFLVWTTGGGTLTLPNIGTVPNGFYFSLTNAGSGTITVSGNANIDNTSSKVIGLTQSLTIIKANNLWWSLGYGQQTFFATGINNKDVAGNQNKELTAAEAEKVIQQFTGELTGDITVFFPSDPNQWTVFNNTTGAFTLSVDLIDGASPFPIPQGNRTGFYSDGNNLYNTPTYLTPTTSAFADGTALAPGVTFASSPNSGMYLPAANQIGISAGGTAVLTSTATATTLTQPVTMTTPLALASGGTGPFNAIAAGLSLIQGAASTPVWGGVGLIRILSASDIIETALTNTAYAALSASLIVTVTPLSTASRIVLLANVNIGSDQLGDLQFSRNINGGGWTPVGTANGSMVSFLDGSKPIPYTMLYIDAPATIQSTQYRIESKIGSAGNYYLNLDGGASYFYAFELGALNA